MNDIIDQSFKEALLNPELSNTILELGELGYDSLMRDGVLKEIPLLGIILSVGKTYGNIRDYFFAKTILKFLKELGTLSDAEKSDLIAKMESDKDYNTSVGGQVITLLSRLDDERKPELVAKAFKLYTKGQLTFVQLQRVNYAIERILLCDIDKLEEFCSEHGGTHLPRESPVYANFINAGIGINVSGFGGGGTVSTETAQFLILVIKS